MEQNRQYKKNGMGHADSKPKESREESVPISIGANGESQCAVAVVGDNRFLPACTVSCEEDKIFPQKSRLSESTRRAEHEDTNCGGEFGDRRSANVQETSLSPPIRTDTLPFDDPQNGQASSFKNKIARAVTEEEHILVLKKAVLKRMIQVREEGGDPQNLRRLEAAFELLLGGRTEDVMRCLCGQDIEDSKQPFPRH